MNNRTAFFIGLILHLFFIWTRIKVFPFKDFGCINKDCTSIVVADIPISIIYLAFSDPILILFSGILGSLLWGLYFFLIYKLFYKLFKY
jgi:hypothetical protein